MFTTLLAIAFLGGCLGMPTTSDIPESTTTEAIDCSLYRPNPQDNHTYEVFVQGDGWTIATCPHALIWDQDLCRCEEPPYEDLECPGHREVPGVPNQYQIQMWGIWQDETLECPSNQIWNQTGCRCDWDPEGPGAVVEVPGFEYPTVARSCEIMFNATFNVDIKEHQSNYYIGRDPWLGVSVQAVDGAIGGGAVRLDDAKMVIWAMAGNYFSDAFQIQLRFKVDAPSDENITLFSNDCESSDPSMVVKYNSLSNVYHVLFRDSVGITTLDCQAQSTPQGFVDVSLELQEESFVLVVDGQAACQPTAFVGEPPISQCPLTLGGDPLKVDSNLKGYMDEVVIRRYCVVTA